MAPTWSSEEEATTEIQKICDEIKSEVEKKVKRKFSDFIAKNMIYQVPEKIEYIIKVLAGADQWIHVKVFQDLPFRGGKVQFVKNQYPKDENDPITPF